MADYFTNFSLVLELNEEQQEYALDLVKQVQAYRDQEQPLSDNFPSELREVIESWGFEVEVQQGIWIHSINGGQEVACLFIQHLLQKFQFAQFVSFEWSQDCSKPKTDAFGGGAAFITETEIETFTTSDWLASKSC